SAGTVNAMAAASDSPADAQVCAKLFSRIDEPRSALRRIAIDMTAEGMDALMVRPMCRPRYVFAEPKISASTMPSTIARPDPSGGPFSPRMYGVNPGSLRLTARRTLTWRDAQTRDPSGFRGR